MVDSRAKADGRNWETIDTLVGDVVNRNLLAGATMLVWQDGIVHEAAVGVRNIANRAPMTLDTIFRLYSMTKPVTAAAMMLLWDEGRWKPDDLLSSHLPELGSLRVLDASGTTVTPETPITIEHLMTHQAGFGYGLLAEPIDDLFRSAGIPSFPYDIEPDDYLARLATVPLAFHPGAGWRYSAAMDIQGLLVERLSGQPYAEFLEERLFGPLGMVDTGFTVPDDKRGRFASLYTLLPDDRLYEVTLPQMAPDHHAPPKMASGGAGLVSTAIDYLRFGRMLLGNGKLDGIRVLSDQAVRLMTSSHTPAHLLTGEYGTAPHVLRPGYEYAYNGIVVTDPELADVALGRGTYFWDGAAGTWFWVDPDNQLVFVCLVQLLNDADRLSLQFKSRGIVADIITGRVP